MNSHLRTAVGDAMNLLRTADVIGATAAIQRGLGGGSPPTAPVANDEATEAAGFRATCRPLAEVLKALRLNRASFAEAGAPGAVDDDDMTPAEGGERFVSRKHRSAAGSVGYKLYVPADHAQRELALVVMLHGCTQNPDDFARGTQMNRLAEEFGLIVAYPHQPRSANAQGCWNWFDPRHQQRGSGEPAVLAALAQELAQEFGVRDGRIFAAGLSAGGAMADILASTHPEVFAAVCVHSGLPSGAASDVMSAFGAMKGEMKASRPVHNGPVSRKIIVHGAADGTVHASNGERILERVLAQSPGSALLKTDSTVNGRRVTRTLLDDADGGALAEHWLVHGASHAWSGGDRGGSFTDATGPEASREMLRFFLQG
jgi:poly(hydroxyalkanoate) depolymerase family esterase